MDRRIRRIGRILIAGVALVAAQPAAVVAGPPESSGVIVRVQDTGGVWYDDLEDGLIVLTGPPAEQWCLGEGFEDTIVETQGALTPSGAVIVLRTQSEAPAWVYESPNLDSLCGLVIAGGSPEPLADGTVRFVINDNNFFGSQDRMTSFGDRATGTVADGDGNEWHLTATFRGVLELTEDGGCGCILIRSDINLRPIGG